MEAGTTVSLTRKRELLHRGALREGSGWGEQPFAHSCSSEGPGPGLGRWEHPCGRPWLPQVCALSKTHAGHCIQGVPSADGMRWPQVSVTVSTHANLLLPQLLHQLNVGALTDESKTCPEGAL